MKTQLTWILTGLTVALGATCAFGDGIMSDAETVRAQGGVGNFLFYDQYRNREKTTAADAEMYDADRQAAIRSEDEMPLYDPYDDAFYDDSSDSLNLGASSAGRAH